MDQRARKQWEISALRESRLTTFLLGVIVVLAIGFVLRQMASIFQPLMIAIFLSFIFLSFFWTVVAGQHRCGRSPDRATSPDPMVSRLFGDLRSAARGGVRDPRRT